MATPLTTFAHDRSARWILVPGTASTRQIEIRNETDAPIEAQVRVEQPTAASVSPAVLSIPPRHSRLADVIVLATWSPGADRQVVLSFQDMQGSELGRFVQEIVAADSADCTLAIDLKDDVLVENALLACKLWCTLTSRSATPRRFEVNFTPHAALRFPDHKTVTLGPGESSAFEVPVQWNRAVRDISGWNHPRAIEAYVPVTEGRRTAVLPWDRIEQRFAPYLSTDDRQAKIVAAPAERRTAFLEKTPGQLKYEELVELKRLEQGVVAAASERPVAKMDDLRAAAQAPPGRRSLLPTFVTIAFALVALVLAGLFFLRPPLRQASDGPVSVAPPLKISPGPLARLSPGKTHAKPIEHVATARPAWSSIAEATREPNTVTRPVASHEQSEPTPLTVAAAARPEARTAVPVDRNEVVMLTDVEAGYTSGGHAVNVAWTGAAQASALVQLVDFTGKVIASRTVRGNGAQTTVRLPRGYHGPLSVNVTAYGYRGERVVQSASLVSSE
jgi:hypothetical protein